MHGREPAPRVMLVRGRAGLIEDRLVLRRDLADVVARKPSDRTPAGKCRKQTVRTGSGSGSHPPRPARHRLAAKLVGVRREAKHRVCQLRMRFRARAHSEAWEKRLRAASNWPSGRVSTDFGRESCCLECARSCEIRSESCGLPAREENAIRVDARMPARSTTVTAEWPCCRSATAANRVLYF